MKTNMKGMFDLPFAEYQKVDAINKSALDQIAKSPAHYQEWLLQPEDPTAAMIFGSAAHSAILEPELLYKNYFARPDGIDGRTKEGKFMLAELGAANAGKTMLKADEFACLEGMMKSVRRNGLVSGILAGGKAEMSVFAEHPLGVFSKARPDYLGKNGVIYDIKTTEDATFFAFQRSVKKFRYNVQAAWYLDIVNAAGIGKYEKFCLIAIEKSAPYCMITYEFDADAITLGRAAATANVETYLRCKERGEWPGYPEHVMTMSMPLYE